MLGYVPESVVGPRRDGGIPQTPVRRRADSETAHLRAQTNRLIATPSGSDAIIAMAPNAWHGPWMNRQQLLSRLAATGTRIVYSTGQWFSWQRHDPAWRAAPMAGSMELADGVRIEHAPRWLMRIPRLPRLDRASIALEARRLRRLLGPGRRAPFTLYLFHPAFQPYAAAMRPARLIYHAYDLFPLMPGWSDELARQERWLLGHAGLRIASSELTAEHLAHQGGRPVHTLANAADTARFRRALQGPEPPDLAAVPHPRIGYVGAINVKVDLALIAELARRRPHWQFVLVGPLGELDDATRAALAQCRALANVHELGLKPYTEVPAYAAHIDVGLIPYRLRPDLWTIAAAPLKLYEYLAANRPIVSCDTAAIRRFRDVVTVADSADEWETAIERILDHPDAAADRRSRAVDGHDWADRVATLRAWLMQPPDA